MKLQEFRKLIREEIRKTLKENVITDLEVMPSVLKIKDKDPETNWYNIQKKYKTKLIKKITSDMSEDPLEIHEIIGTPYIVVDEMGMGVIFKKSDMPKVVAAIKDGSYFDMD